MLWNVRPWAKASGLAPDQSELAVSLNLNPKMGFSFLTILSCPLPEDLGEAWHHCTIMFWWKKSSLKSLQSIFADRKKTYASSRIPGHEADCGMPSLFPIFRLQGICLLFLLFLLLLLLSDIMGFWKDQITLDSLPSKKRVQQNSDRKKQEVFRKCSMLPRWKRKDYRWIN